MFSGIVETTGTICSLDTAEDGYVLGIRSELFEKPPEAGGFRVGDSVSCSGVCLTVTRLSDGAAYFDLATETRRCTTLGDKGVGSHINLEPSVSVNGRLHGHIVSGHVDEVGTLLAVEQQGNTVRYLFSLPENIAPLVAPKGSVTIDGVSLTVGEVVDQSFSVYIIPHTSEITTFSSLAVGDRVNLEADLIARYVHRLLECKEEGNNLGSII